ncbi:reverse transcriptase family protein [Pseudoalteromonas sp. Of11M-6]|uniref:reverse transcriptase family protein n=1 Tax=Pseudoalteromonas sp. Of11M-6 TaxID=2917754 RepID=UPI001EF67C7D|nr:reverse transcriptase family protein [Pseudoalteromonas sp. Of11M-6]MCG7555285.1 reverse transcriptase family protein [Pseudoalteromonas sp. Of11M-6]
MNNESTKRSLKDIFSSTFHDKMSFDDFLRLDVNREFKTINLRKRLVYAPSAKLKQVHRFINKTILEFADCNTNVVFSYRKGVSTRDAVEIHSHSNYIFQTDLSKFFNNIHRDDVMTALKSQLSNAPVSDIDLFIEKIVDLVVIDDHIPAGFSTSPLLSNICLFRFDNALEAYCEANELKYTRYSDDLIVSGSLNDFTESIETVIDNLLIEHVNNSLCINKAKTKTHKVGHSFKILGFNILPNGVVTIPSPDKKEVESLLYFFLTDDQKFEDFFKKCADSKTPETDDKTIRERAIGMLSGKLIAFNAMDKQYVAKLRRKYGNTVIDMFIRKSVT